MWVRYAVVVLSLLCTISWPAIGNQGAKTPKIGILLGSDADAAKPYEDAFRDGLRSLGYVDGSSVVLIPLYAQGDPKRFPALAKELIAADVNILVAAITALPAAMASTHTIPIVAPTMGSDPVGDGLVASVARPGGNVTGGYAGPLEPKRYQFAIETIPGLKRVGLLFEATNPTYAKWATRSRARAESLGEYRHNFANSF